METIIKYELSLESNTKLRIPKYARILSLSLDGKTGKPCMFVVGNVKNHTEQRIFELFETGDPIQQYNAGAGREFIGTYQIGNGSFEGHVFERVNI